MLFGCKNSEILNIKDSAIYFLQKKGNVLLNYFKSPKSAKADGQFN